MPYLAGARRRSFLGDAWSDYTSSGRGPAGGSVTSPNGDTVYFDADGGPDHTVLHATSSKDSDVEKDPASQFFGWTQLQKAQFYAAKGATGLLTDAVRATATPVANGVSTYDAGAVAANDAALKAAAHKDPVVSAAIEKSNAGAAVVTPHGEAIVAAGLPPAPKSLDEWWVLHGGGPRYQTAGGRTFDYLVVHFQNFSDAEIRAALGNLYSDYLAAAKIQAAADEAEKTHGGYDAPDNPNARSVPIAQTYSTPPVIQILPGGPSVSIDPAPPMFDPASSSSSNSSLWIGLGFAAVIAGAAFASHQRPRGRR